MRYNYERYKKQMAAAEQQLVFSSSPRSITRKKQVYYKAFKPKPELPWLELPLIGCDRWMGGSALEHKT
jgi:hypothetical protein